LLFNNWTWPWYGWKDAGMQRENRSKDKGCVIHSLLVAAPLLTVCTVQLLLYFKWKKEMKNNFDFVVLENGGKMKNGFQ
jgi:hypothetical protein